MISIQSSAPPPPPPPLPATPAGLLLAAVTVSVADAGPALPPAGPVTRALEGMLAVYVLATALWTLSEISQLPLAGIFAADSVTLLVVLVRVSDAPLQVLDGACEPTVRLAGKDMVIPDCVSANPLVLPKVTTSMAGAFAATLAGEKAALTVGAAGVTVIGAMHALALVPAERGAVVLAPPAVKLMTAVSVLPAESVTTTLSVPVPLDVAFTCAVAPPELMTTAPVLDQA